MLGESVCLLSLRMTFMLHLPRFIKVNRHAYNVWYHRNTTLDATLDLVLDNLKYDIQYNLCKKSLKI